MSQAHQTLIDTATEAIGEVFNDTTVSRATTRESLLTLRDEINERLATIRPGEDEDEDTDIDEDDRN